MARLVKKGNDMKRFQLATILLAASFATVPLAVYAEPLPQIRNGQLVVNGQPYLALGGELHNSSASSPDYMQPIWDKLQSMHVQTVVSTVSWEDFEPEEGRFDYTALDAQLAEARKRDMRIVLIWFGAFKNATSTYTPTWVRANKKRFPRAIATAQLKEAFTYAGAMPKPVLSVFSPELLDADRRAFAKMMSHLAKVDTDHRVIMVQVNNESGMLRDSRDRSSLANAAWNQAVPPTLLRYLAENKARLKPELREVWARQGSPMRGSWAQVFGEDWQAEEIFMAWHFARYMEALALEGKKALALPMYANAWLGPQPGQPTAGQYPSGGPAKRVLDIWKSAAPSLDLLAPDIYVADAKGPLADYDFVNNAVFVPEAQFRTGDMFWALGQHAAIGFSVFGIEDGRTDSQLAEAFAILNPMRDIIARAQAEKRIAGVLIDDGKPAIIKMGRYSIAARETSELLKQMLLDVGLQAPPTSPSLPSETDGPGTRPAPGDARPFGFIIDEGNGSFLLVGRGFTPDFSVDGKLTEIDRTEEGRFDNNIWKPGRVINGDERLTIIPMDCIGMVRVRLLP